MSSPEPEVVAPEEQGNQARDPESLKVPERVFTRYRNALVTV